MFVDCSVQLRDHFDQLLPRLAVERVEAVLVVLCQRVAALVVHARAIRDSHHSGVYDSESAQVTHYINGENVGELPITTDKFKLRFGETETEIGNWGTPMNYSPQKIRNFNGQIDELTLFSKALKAKEIQSLYTTGLR